MELNNQENGYQEENIVLPTVNIKKPFYKRAWFIILVAIISVVIISFGAIAGYQMINSFSSNDNKAVQASTTTQVPSTPTRPIPNESAFKEKLYNVFNGMDPKMRVYSIDFTTVNNEPFVTIKITWDGLSETLALCKTYGYVPDNYTQLLQKLANASLTVKNSAFQYNYDSLSCSLQVLNDSNPSKILIATKDGSIIYDMLTATN